MTTFMDVFDKEYLPKLGIRGATFRAVMREVEHLEIETIVETGSVRKLDNWDGDGQSTIILNRWASMDPFGTFNSVDVSEEAHELVKANCKNTVHICSDSIAYLKSIYFEIGLLYLDSLDVNMENPHDSAMHTLMELMTALPRLKKGSIVFVDDSPIDTNMRIGGKGFYVAQYFQKIGVSPFTFGYQAAWIMP